MWKILILVMIVLSGCATLTPEEREYQKEQTAYRRVIDLLNWELCMNTYKHNGGMTVHRNHQHGRGHPTLQADSFDIRWDLTDNNCKLVLGEHFAGY